MLYQSTVPLRMQGSSSVNAQRVSVLCVGELINPHQAHALIPLFSIKGKTRCFNRIKQSYLITSVTGGTGLDVQVCAALDTQQ